jgi:hypothetical protein
MEENGVQELETGEVLPSEISVSVNSKDGRQKEYVFPETAPSDSIVLESVACTAADMGVQVLEPWKAKLKEEVDSIKQDFYLEEVELNFGIAKFKLRRKRKG